MVYVAEEDYSKWLEQHIAVYHYSHPHRELESKKSNLSENSMDKKDSSHSQLPFL